MSCLRKVDVSMFFTFEKIKELADKQGISLNKLEEKLGFSRNTIYNMKKSTPNVERVKFSLLLTVVPLTCPIFVNV